MRLLANGYFSGELAALIPTLLLWWWQTKMNACAPLNKVPHKESGFT